MQTRPKMDTREIVIKQLMLINDGKKESFDPTSNIEIPNPYSDIIIIYTVAGRDYQYIIPCTSRRCHNKNCKHSIIAARLQMYMFSRQSGGSNYSVREVTHHELCRALETTDGLSEHGINIRYSFHTPAQSVDADKKAPRGWVEIENEWVVDDIDEVTNKMATTEISDLNYFI